MANEQAEKAGRSEPKTVRFATGANLAIDCSEDDFQAVSDSRARAHEAFVAGGVATPSPTNPTERSTEEVHVSVEEGDTVDHEDEVVEVQSERAGEQTGQPKAKRQRLSPKPSSKRKEPEPAGTSGGSESVILGLATDAPTSGQMVVRPSTEQVVSEGASEETGSTPRGSRAGKRARQVNSILRSELGGDSLNAFMANKVASDQEQIDTLSTPAMIAAAADHDMKVTFFLFVNIMNKYCDFNGTYPLPGFTISHRSGSPTQ